MSGNFLNFCLENLDKSGKNIPPKLDNHNHFHWQIYDDTDYPIWRQNFMTYLLQKCRDCLIYDDTVMMYYIDTLSASCNL